ncbi:zinc ribbon domain-containing protein [Treponema phagedenis]|uniref:Zinc ribbon domain-containing protein n=1 Tax=Treponema phagedenis TaxID=162 RepID=A0A0B7H2A3_TREPH|nr:zinc ribbon domain-containing protein [Treponema phagedenis]NVP24600.1 zinc ribbon domain-containing protein [Treponema phagedenis]QEJ94707.1 zinc ribbon domain-containing protein [Treponema phagedenis]QEJ97643.1 zinc ribbon domain-containing protein [Treponema phagedenis]QEK00611.1 zinc ribbon domain-containing protein [Treponema phagedenis]QEK03212.1 zinc ribbon domain-containing protein [Treponema phagedenis]
MHKLTNNIMGQGLSGDRQSVFHCTACGHGFIATAKATGIFSPLGGTPKCPKCGSRKTIEIAMH